MIKRGLSITVLTAVLLTCCSCSPFFIMRAGWEEAKILLNKEPLEELVKDNSIEGSLRDKFQLVIDARAFAETLGLKPGGSFTEYSDIERDVLVWVLSASPKTSLTPYTWWFPVVGRVPYKGFFDKEDGLTAAKKLVAKNMDIFLRPSPAFSTLGWFDDPLLSTYSTLSDAQLVTVVMHEIFHNTVWIKNQAHFNETAANFVGLIVAKEFFYARNEKEKGDSCWKTWKDELIFADFLQTTRDNLQELYEKKLPEAEVLKIRKKIFTEATNNWKEKSSALQMTNYKKAADKLNNANIIAYSIYLTKPHIIMQLFEDCNNSLKCFIDTTKGLEEQVNEEKLDPYKAIELHLRE